MISKEWYWRTIDCNFFTGRAWLRNIYRLFGGAAGEQTDGSQKKPDAPSVTGLALNRMSYRKYYRTRPLKFSKGM